MSLEQFLLVHEIVHNVEMALRGIEALHEGGAPRSEHEHSSDPAYHIGKLARVLADHLHLASDALGAIPLPLSPDVHHVPGRNGGLEAFGE